MVLLRRLQRCVMLRGGAPTLMKVGAGGAFTSVIHSRGHLAKSALPAANLEPNSANATPGVALRTALTRTLAAAINKSRHMHELAHEEHMFRAARETVRMCLLGAKVRRDSKHHAPKNIPTGKRVCGVWLNRHRGAPSPSPLPVLPLLRDENAEGVRDGGAKGPSEAAISGVLGVF